MNKSFLSVSPSEGNGNAQVVINVKENGGATRNRTGE